MRIQFMLYSSIVRTIAAVLFDDDDDDDAPYLRKVICHRIICERQMRARRLPNNISTHVHRRQRHIVRLTPCHQHRRFAAGGGTHFTVTGSLVIVKIAYQFRAHCPC